MENKYFTLLIFGTRPEFLKLIPVITEFKKRNDLSNIKILFTRQHRELVEPLFDLFNIYPDYKFDFNPNVQSLHESIIWLDDQLYSFLSENNRSINYILAQGDTTSCFCAAKAASRFGIPFGHIEAGLRTYNLSQPFPEEFFRQIITSLSSVHFVPTIMAYNNLGDEGIHSSKIIFSGNTIVDFNQLVKINSYKDTTPEFENQITEIKKDTVLISCHRRENHGRNFELLASSVIYLAHEHPELRFVWISHPNPTVTKKLQNLKTRLSENVTIVQPMSFLELYNLYQHLTLIITDSGGIQEEAVFFRIPVIVIRDLTERMETIQCGYAVATGCNPKKIKRAFHHLVGKKLPIVENPYGDGNAAIRIANYFSNLHSSQSLEMPRKKIKLENSSMYHALSDIQS